MSSLRLQLTYCFRLSRDICCLFKIHAKAKTPSRYLKDILLTCKLIYPTLIWVIVSKELLVYLIWNGVGGTQSEHQAV